MNRNFKCVLSVARSEYIKWITNPRVIIVGVLLVFMRTLAIEPLLERAAKMEIPLNILEPFVAIGNSGISFLCVVLTGSVLLSKGEFSTMWSDVVTKYSARFPDEANSFTSSLLPSNLYNQIPLITAILQTLALMCAYLFLLSMIIYFFKLIHIQSFGLFAAISIVAAGVVTCSLKMNIMWSFPMANTIVWLHYEEIIGKPIVPIWYSYIYFCIAVIILVLLNLIAVKRFQFANIEQVE